MTAEPLWSRGEVAKFLQVSERTVRRLTEEGRLPSVLVGKQRRYEPDAVRTWVKSLLAPRVS